MILGRMRLSHRFTLVFSLIVLAMTGVLFVAMDRYFRGTLTSNAEHRASGMGQALATVSLPHLLRYDYLTVQQVVDGVVDGQEVLYAIVLDKEGKVAGYSGQRDRQGFHLDDAATRSSLAAEAPNLRNLDWNDGEHDVRVVEAVFPVRPPGETVRWGTVRLGLSLETVSHQLWVTRVLLAVIGLAGVFAATLASLLLARRITQPLRRLVEATERLESGEWDPEFRVDTGDEIGDLARKFSRAASSLEEQTRRLRQAKEELTALNSTLEDKVEQRTAELHSSNEKYRLLVEGSLDAFCLLDGEQFVFVNPAFLEIFGRDEEEVSIGLGWDQILHPNFLGQARARFEALEAGAPPFEEEWVGVSKQGRIIDLEVRGRWVPYEGREVVELVLVDVTQKKTLIQQIVQNERMRAMGEMTAMVAHHFNNILAIIHGRAQLVQRKVQDPRLAESLEVIQSSVLKAGEMVRHLQDYFGEQFDLRFVEVDVNALLEDVVFYQERVWRSSRPREAPPIEVHMELDAIPPVRGAGPLLRDAFGRILVNAVEAMPMGGDVYVRSKANATHVTVEIEDKGTGMDAETLSRAFDPFFSTKGSASRGLGLSASLGIMQRHEGRISLKSEPAEGTSVSIVLPIEARVSRIVPFGRAPVAADAAATPPSGSASPSAPGAAETGSTPSLG
ncbi:MAG: PAS domain S-box protein [Candidatus Eisenbacteria bacterium]|uniref:histidine kinase n=1 Tax=Eiseniibacteriota bacterium TaxID=2212470 RepID=A0A956NFP2_UNCEI|nr:PAS domain S-box protein [Candidatus Eisenbacteria bacterium]MCB9462432.1 PAS domain S-box protein [Candidatus Eisenbacteria bacterium]